MFYLVWRRGDFAPRVVQVVLAYEILRTSGCLTRSGAAPNHTSKVAKRKSNA